MDIQETISRVRKEYKDYLREKHPDWAESSLSTHVSDAFYLYQNTIAPLASPSYPMYFLCASFTFCCFTIA